MKRRRHNAIVGWIVVSMSLCAYSYASTEACLNAGLPTDLVEWAELILFAPDDSIIQNHPENPNLLSWVQPLVDARGPLNLDFYTITISQLPFDPSSAGNERMQPEDLLTLLRLNINDFLNTRVGYFKPLLPSDETSYQSPNPRGSVIHIDMGTDINWWWGPFANPDDGSVVVSEIAPTHWRFTTIYTEHDSYHPVSGTREFGFFQNAEGAYVFYTRGADRPTTWLDYTTSNTVFYWADVLWKSLQQNFSAYVNANGGKASFVAPTANRYDWDSVLNCLASLGFVPPGTEGTRISDDTSVNTGEELVWHLEGDETLFEGCPDRDDVSVSATAESIRFDFEDGKYVAFAWHPPIIQKDQVTIKYWVDGFSAQPPTPVLGVTVNGSAGILLSALDGWDKSFTRTVTLNPNVDEYELEVHWRLSQSYFLCGDVSRIVHRYVIK